MAQDIWFTRHGGQLYVSFAEPGEAPHITKRASSVAKVYEAFKDKKKVASVGIASPETIGLE